MASTLPLKKWYYVLHSTKNSLIFVLSMIQQPGEMAKKEIRESIAMNSIFFLSVAIGAIIPAVNI